MPIRLCYGDCVDDLPRGLRVGKHQTQGQFNEQQRFGSEGGIFYFAAPYPNPFRGNVSTVVEFVDTQRVRFEILDLNGGLIEVLADTVQEEGHIYQYQWRPSEGILHGVYQFHAIGEVTSDTVYAVYSEVGDGTYLTGHLVISLGQTDIAGELVVDDSTRFPFLYDGTDRIERTDAQGNILGLIDLGRQVTIILEDEDGGQRGFLRALADSGNDFELVWN